MSYGVIHYFPGGTREQYDASIAAVHPSATELPDGQVFHAAGPSQGGWTIIAVHDTRASWESFRDDILMPRIDGWGVLDFIRNRKHRSKIFVMTGGREQRLSTVDQELVTGLLNKPFDRNQVKTLVEGCLTAVA